MFGKERNMEPPPKKFKGQAPKKNENTKSSTLLSSKGSCSKTPGITSLKEKDDNRKGPKNSHISLAEKMRPTSLKEYIGQKHILGPHTVLHDLLEKREIPSMILWGPPGCGKTSLANVISQICKETPDGEKRFVKLSAMECGIGNIKEAAGIAANELKLGRRTIIFMDEIHRFNKLQQDIFLPHVERGTIILVGATTENPSFSLNSALLSRCRVFILESLSRRDVTLILERAIQSMKGVVGRSLIKFDKESQKSEASSEDINCEETLPKFIIDRETIEWLAETCGGDARIALGGLELSVRCKVPVEVESSTKTSEIISLNDIKESLEKSHVSCDRKSDRYYDLILALHKSVRGNNANASLYWLARIMAEGEDPVNIARRLVRISGEDVGLADPDALGIAVHTMHACQMIGMPECDVPLAQCVVYLSRAPKSRLVDNALRRAQRLVENQKGPQPLVPVHIRDRSGKRKLMAALGSAKGNLLRKEDSRAHYLPEGLEDVTFFKEEIYGSE